MSHGVESKASVKKRNAQPARSALRSEQGRRYKIMNPDKVQEYQKRFLDLHGPRATQLIEAFDPLVVTENGPVMLTCDWHIPLHDEVMVKRMLTTAKENNVKRLIIVGDFFDCDNISKFHSITQTSTKQTFKGEQEEVLKMFKRMLNVFEYIDICSGNHEYRWCAITNGNSDVKDLYRQTFPAAFDGGKYEGRIRVTNDDNITLTHCGKKWLLCHPKNFRVTPLSVAKDLAAKHLMNILVAHGHGFAQGRDKSGQYICIDGGGLYERAALEYARRTTCHPMTRSGYYMLKSGTLISFEGKI